MTRMFAVLISALLLFTGTAFAESVDWGDLVKRDELYYKKFTNEPFSVEATGMHQGKLVDGKLNGPWVLYHENGQLRRKENYNNDELDGASYSYDKNDQFSSILYYYNGKLK